MSWPRLPFEAYFQRKSDDECWIWRGRPSVYGVFKRDKRTYLAHRLSYEIAHGPIPQGQQVCHRCDIPGCVNPRHLFLGSWSENMRDMFDKRRHTVPKPGNQGQRNGNAKLSNSDAYEIWRLANAGAPIKLIASRFGVSKTTVSTIKHGRAWRQAIGTQI